MNNLFYYLICLKGNPCDGGLFNVNGGTVKVSYSYLKRMLFALDRHNNRLYQLLRSGFHIDEIILTGRPDGYGDVTFNWVDDKDGYFTDDEY